MREPPHPLAGLDLNLLLLLRAVLEERSVTAAARRMRRTQPTVSRHLATLRRTFGDPLVVRDARGARLTALGEVLLPQVRALLDDVARLRESASFDPRRVERTFRIAMADVVATALLPPLAAAVAPMPRISLAVRHLEVGLADALASGATDLALVGHPLDGGDLHQQRLAEDALVAVLGPRHPAYARPLDVDDLARSRHVLLTPSGNPDAVGQLDLALARHGARRSVALRLTHFAALANVLLATDWIASVPSRLAGTIVNGTALRAVPLPLECPPLVVHQVWHARVDRDPGHRWLRGEMAAAARAFATSHGP